MKSILVAVLIAAAGAPAGRGGSVRGSKHDLSVTGPGPIKAESETEVCIFCHVPHAASVTADHLSGRPEIGNEHVPYGSSTARSRPGAPTGVSRVCLSCHDGTIAVGQTLTKTIRMRGVAQGGRIAADRRSNLGTDLRRTHPVSVIPPSSPALRRPSPRTAVHLDEGGRVQCTSCHDPHSEFSGSPEGKFLLEQTADSVLCVECHVFPRDSGHFTSPRGFGTAEGNAAGYGSVGTAGCMACHRSHGTDPRGRLLARSETDQDDVLCLRCHSGQASRTNIGRELAKPSAHTNGPGRGKHDPSEGPDDPARRLPEKSAGADRHVACVDCHDPHLATDRGAVAPLASGRNAGVWGIDQAGKRVAPAGNQYEICLKCHGDSANKPPSRPFAPRRAAEDRNLRRVFDPAAPSSHPVMAPGGNSVPGLLPPFTVASHVYCTDCHASDEGPGAGGTGPRGPHGSIYAPMLERRYTTGDRAVESPEAYALCYKCHDRNVLLSSRSGFSLKACPDEKKAAGRGRSRIDPSCTALHRIHVVDAQAPCSVCHSAHGVSAIKGTPAGNAHLVDFDLDVVKNAAGPTPPYASNGPRSGSCSLTCHGRTHQGATY